MDLVLVISLLAREEESFPKNKADAMKRPDNNYSLRKFKKSGFVVERAQQWVSGDCRNHIVP